MNYVVRQTDIKDCAACSVLSIIRYYKGDYPKERLNMLLKTDKDGTNAFNIIETLNSIGFSSKGVKCYLEDLEKVFIGPVIAHVIINNTYKHFVVIYKIDPVKKELTVMDPGVGMKKYSYSHFKEISTSTFILVSKTKDIPFIKNEKLSELIIKMFNTNKHKLMYIIILSLMFTIFNILALFYFKYIVDNLYTISKSNFYNITFIFLYVLCFKFIIAFIRNKLIIYLNSKIDISFITDTYSHILSLPYNYYKNKTSGEIITRIQDIYRLKELISKILISIFIDVILIITSIIFLFRLNTLLSIITITISLIHILLILVFNKKLSYKNSVLAENNSKITSFLLESINSFESIKGLNNINSIYNEFEKRYVESSYFNIHYNRLANIYILIKEFINDIGYFIVLFISAILILNNKFNISDLIIFNSLFYYYIDSIKNVFSIDKDIRDIKISLNRVNDLLGIDKELTREDNKINVFNNNYDINITNLDFTYNDNIILNNISLNIKTGEKIMITGKSGVGKSTLAKILLGYYKINRGFISINNIDICDYSVLSLRENITYVPQKDILFSDTIYNNINFYNNNSTENILEVINITKTNEIYKNDSVGYNKLILENGFNISGGECQRILLARALLVHSKILILDESTNQIDIKTEREIINNILKKYSDKTIIFISHRKDNSDLFDKIINL